MTTIPVPVIPAPARVSPEAGPGFALDQPAEIIATTQHFRALAQRYAIEFEADTGMTLVVGSAETDGRAIVLELASHDPDLAGLPGTLGISPHGGDPAAERYAIDVTAGSIRVRATAQEGLFRGLTTLRQLAAGSASREIPAQRILDWPRFAWRGLSLDVARTFFAVEQVQQVIDILAAYKLNVLHLHLTDDAGWRLDLPGKPRLAQVGGQYAVGDRPGGWYSPDDFARLVRYGADRYVTVLPEIDLPGHANALLRSYPELTATGTPPERVDLPWPPVSALDLDIEGTAEFVEGLLAEVAALTPTPFLHIGGDEVFILPDAAFRRFVEHTTTTVRRLGKRPVGWQEIARAGIEAGDVVQYWFDRTDEMASAGGSAPDLFAAAGQDAALAVRKGARILLSPSRFNYLDVPYAEPSSDPAQEEQRLGLGLGVYSRSSVRDAMGWDPEALLAGIAPPESLAGVEAALWCETVADLSDACFLLLPRLPGVAEKAWSAGRPFDWHEYRGRLAAQAPIWQRRGWNFFRSSLVDFR